MKRDLTIDISKGLAIVAIVLGHVLRGLVTSGVIEDSQRMQVTDNVIYSFHLSVFAFLSGLFVARGILREGTYKYVSARTATFLYCYVVWTLLQGLVRMASGQITAEPVPFIEILSSLWRADTQLWFFGFLIVASLAAAIAQPWKGSSRAWATIVIFGISLLFWGIGVPALFGSTLVFFAVPGWGLLGFFVVGAGWQHFGLVTTLDRLGLKLPVIALGSISVFIACHLLLNISTPTESPNRTVESIAFGVITSIAGVIAVVLVSRLLTKTPAAGPLSFIGQHSLEIFLAHIIAASGTRTILSKFGVDDFVPQLAAGVIAGIGFPLILCWISKKIGFIWLFQKPTIRHRAGNPSYAVK